MNDTSTNTSPHIRRQQRSRRGRAVLALAGAGTVAAGAVALAAGGSDHARAPTPRSALTETAAPEPSRSMRLESISTGGGIRGAEILRPKGGEHLPGVVFLHGWGLVSRADYRPWIRHLARDGNQVIVPRYQRDERSDPGEALGAAIAGIRRALRLAPRAGHGLVVAGHSAGGALAADYAASARARGLPEPLAVVSVYPGRKIIGYPAGIPEADPARISPGTRIVAMAGASDTVVGQAPAHELVAAASRVASPRKRFVLVEQRSLADHYGPTRSTRLAARVFWERLDRLIVSARR